MKNAQEAYEKLVRCINVRHYIGPNGAAMIEAACQDEEIVVEDNQDDTPDSDQNDNPDTTPGGEGGTPATDPVNGKDPKPKKSYNPATA